MQELIDRLKDQAGLTNEQALQSIMIIKDYAKEKFPLFAGAIEQMFKKYSPKEEDDFLE
jgi:hypothetical protein